MSRTDGEGVTVLMPVFNGQRFLREQLDSILAQTHPDVRVIAVDDRSTDGSVAILRAYAAEHPAVRVIEHEENGGLIATLSELLAMVETPYFALSDQDDIWDPNKIERSISTLESTGAALVYSDVRVCDEAGGVTTASYLASRGIKPVEGRDPIPFVFRNPAIGHTMLGRREVAIAASPVPASLRYHEAWIVGTAMTRGTVSFVPDQLGSYRLHDSNVVGPRRSSVKARVANLARNRAHLSVRQGTREAALAALARLDPRLVAPAVSYSSRGLRRVPAFPHVAAFLWGARGDVGRRGLAIELGLWIVDSFSRGGRAPRAMVQERRA